ncbi:hypothetical protein MIS46_00525 [Wielerella bovis]|uniref:hypothetical protein n=1 Tax=Wielerella bovis TaxID=2917790 RepID=UPI002018457C|nr:hypothetical protein [Wielerella bovis]ULJ62620.1 hypothetical protein MIS46_00525 [Wielerella bovis]
MKKLAFVAAALLAVIPTLSTAETYYSCGGGYYSDVPLNMKAAQCALKTSRGSTVRDAAPVVAPARPLSLIEQQADLNNRIAEENRRREEESAKAAAEVKAENCKAAQMNKETVERTNARNKAELLPKYEADIAKYCN